MRKSLPPAPPDPVLTHATQMFDPRVDAPAAEGRQQLIVSNLWLTKPRERKPLSPYRPARGIFAGKRLMIRAQSLELGANGRRLAAVQFFTPKRGLGAEDGSRRLTMLDKFFERTLGHIPRPGTFALADLIGLNFMADVERSTRRHGEERHPAAYFLVINPDCCQLYDDWPKYPPVYRPKDEVFKPLELADEKI